jgi:para-aminobenzoate synthetase component 1
MSRNLQPWYWRSLPLENRTGSEVFAALFLQNNGISTLLESPTGKNEPWQNSRYSICAGTPRINQKKTLFWTPAIGEIIPFLRQLIQVGKQETKVVEELAHLPFTGGWLGWLGYDLAWEIEKLPIIKTDSLPFPVAYWYEPENFAVLDHKEQILRLAATNANQLDALQSKVEEYKPAEEKKKKKIKNSALHFFSNKIDYEDAVRQAKKYIQVGDIFQANLSVRFAAQTTADSWEIYQALQQINPSPFASYWQTPWGTVISCSPERLVQLQGKEAQTRPIAGTRPRHSDPIKDQQNAQELLENTKENAEHIMLVDLERNDLGRVCEWGSVVVDELLTIERYSHVMHLVSNVKGKLRSHFDAVDLICALFPGGTITGCPKVRCIEIIEELEPWRRNLFYGSCGYLDKRGDLDLNILIRTLLFSHQDNFSELNTIWGQVGAGIVADSDPEKEWFESLHKAQAQLTALHLAEELT